jgi:hypothetical protein
MATKVRPKEEWTIFRRGSDDFLILYHSNAALILLGLCDTESIKRRNTLKEPVIGY